MLLKKNEEWRLEQRDCIEGMADMPEASVDHAIFSPPFPSVYAYTDSGSDLGNSEDIRREGKLHFSFFFRQIRRVLKPGRVMILHCTDIVRFKRSGGQGIADFPGLLIRLGERAGLIHEYRWAIRVNPQSQAIRTKSHELQFSGMERDRADCRGALPAYLLKFRAPGENAVPIDSPGQVNRNDWIALAEHCWNDIIETDTLNVTGTKGEGDTKHVCPLQLSIIRNCVLLYTNPGEIVFSPFAGIGSEGYVSLGGPSPKTKRFINDPRRFFGFEIKDEYVAAARNNLERAIRLRKDRQKTMFDAIPEDEEMTHAAD